MPQPDLSIVVLSWNTKTLLGECLDAIDKGRGGLAVEVIVIENASVDGSGDLVAATYPWVRLERNSENVGYARGVNQGIRLAEGRYVCLLGSDTRVATDALPALVAFLVQHPDVGAVAPRLMNLDGSVQRACMRFPRLATVFIWDTFLQRWFPNAKELRRYQYLEWDHRGTRQVEQPPGTCLVVPRAVIDQVGLMDEKLWLFFNDVDWALRITRAGFQLWYLDDVAVVHHLGGSTRRYSDFGAEWHRNRIAFYRKHWGFVGAFLTKCVLVYVAIRQCFRVRKDLGSWKASKPHCGTIVKMAWGILRRN